MLYSQWHTFSRLSAGFLFDHNFLLAPDRSALWLGSRYRDSKSDANNLVIAHEHTAYNKTSNSGQWPLRLLFSRVRSSHQRYYLSLPIRALPLKLGPGLRHVPPSTITSTLAGPLCIDRKKNAIWVENNTGRVIVPNVVRWLLYC